MGDQPLLRTSFSLNGRRFELDATSVASALEGVAPEALRKHSVNIGGAWFPVRQAFEVATGVSRLEFNSHAARRHLAALGFEVAGAIEARGSSPRLKTASPRPAPPVRRRWERSDGPADLLLVTCVKEKLDHPAAAKDLYTSALFYKQRAYAEHLGIPWFILSAEHGLVEPDEWLTPYERYLPDTPASYRRAWGEWVAARLDLLSGGIAGRTIEIHAGATYLDVLRGPLRSVGAEIVEPLAGLALGHRLAWYDDQPAEAVPVETGASHHRAAVDFCRLLTEDGDALPPSDFIGRGADGLTVPGLYSWWVDVEGAEDLASGLGHEVRPGLIYAGLAGATRWPSGKRSTNTLWSRIAGMHLGKRHEFSTFRRTLGSILAAATRCARDRRSEPQRLDAPSPQGPRDSLRRPRHPRTPRGRRVGRPRPSAEPPRHAEDALAVAH